MSKVKISVIVPIYNMEKYLGECLDTVITQTLKDIEIICVNDGSTDKSEEIIREYARKDPRIKLLSKSNEGVGKARNDGLDMAEGKYVAFMDPDDWYPDNDTLRSLYSKAEEYKVMICGGSFGEQVGDKLVTDFTGVKSKYKFKADRPMSYSEYQFDYGYHRFIYNLDFLNKHEIRFPQYIRFQDPPFFIRAMIKAQMFYAMKRVTYRYRVGTQKIQWTDKKLLHLLFGLRDGIRLSGENDLSILHKTMLERVGKNYYEWYLGRLEEMPCEMALALFELCSAVNLTLLKKDVKSIEYVKKLTDLALRSYELHCSEWEKNSPEEYEKIKKYVDVKYNRLSGVDIPMVKRENNKACKVSVIIPVYNVEAYIEECVQSVVDQTLKEIEIICVNDGTRDASMDIVKRMAEKDSRIVIVNKENGGLSSARNAGLEHVRGEYTLFLDSDDYLRKEALEKLWELASGVQLDDVFFSAKAFYESDELGEKHKSYDDYYTRNSEYTGVWTGQNLFTAFMRNDDFKPSACLQFIRTEFLMQNKIAFYEGIIHEDNLFTLQLMTLAQKVACIKDDFYMRRVREDSIMTQKKGLKNAYGYFVTAKEMVGFLEEHENCLKKYFEEAILQRIDQYYDQASGFVRNVEKNEVEEFLESLEIKERSLFRRMVADMAEINRRYIEEKNLSTKQKRILDHLAKKVSAISNSFSYRIGHILVLPFGKVKRLAKRVLKKIKNV